MTEELFREDATLLDCTATVVAVDEAGVVLDRTVFYPLGGGQAGDAGTLTSEGGAVLATTDTRKHKERPGDIAHVPAPGADLAAFAPGTRVTARIDADRRRAHMRFHTTTHLLCALVPHPVDGCSITATYARLDFHMNEPLDKEALTAGIARLVAGAHAAWAGPRPRAGDRRRGPAALRRHTRRQHRRHRGRGRHQDREEERHDAARGAGLCLKDKGPAEAGPSRRAVGSGLLHLIGVVACLAALADGTDGGLDGVLVPGLGCGVQLGHVFLHLRGRRVEFRALFPQLGLGLAGGDLVRAFAKGHERELVYGVQHHGVVGDDLGIEWDAAIGHRKDAAEVEALDLHDALAVLDGGLGVAELCCRGHGAGQAECGHDGEQKALHGW
jgi:tRNA synthetases class II (A)